MNLTNNDNPLLRLPYEVQLTILNFLQDEDLAICTMVSQDFKRLIEISNEPYFFPLIEKIRCFSLHIIHLMNKRTQLQIDYDGKLSVIKSINAELTERQKHLLSRLALWVPFSIAEKEWSDLISHRDSASRELPMIKLSIKDIEKRIDSFRKTIGNFKVKYFDELNRKFKYNDMPKKWGVVGTTQLEKIDSTGPITQPVFIQVQYSMGGNYVRVIGDKDNVLAHLSLTHAENPYPLYPGTPEGSPVFIISRVDIDDKKVNVDKILIQVCVEFSMLYGYEGRVYMDHYGRVEIQEDLFLKNGFESIDRKWCMSESSLDQWRDTIITHPILDRKQTLKWKVNGLLESLMENAKKK